MTQQSYRKNSAEADSSASSSSSSASTSSNDVYPLPLSLGQKKITLNDEQWTVVSEPTDTNVETVGANICINDSSHIHIGNNTYIHKDAIVRLEINANDRDKQNGVVGQDEDQCNKTVRVVFPPLPPTLNDKPKNVAELLNRHVKAIRILLAMVVLICAASLIILRLVGTEARNFVPILSEELSTTYSPRPKIHVIFNKTQWGGRKLPDPEAIDEPVDLVIVKHTKTQTCEDIPSCFVAMQELQSTDVGVHHLRDIRYNFVIGGDGNIYEGRGWGVRNGQLNNTIDIAYMGDFTQQVPSDWVVGAGLWLIVKGMYNNHLNISYIRVVGDNQTENTDSPGENLFREIIKWDFYSNATINGSFWKNDL